MSDAGRSSAAGGASQSPRKRLIDCHVHLAALDDGSNGCHISPRLRKSLSGFILKRTLGLSLDLPAPEVNRHYLEKLLGHLRASRHVARAVGLAFDAVHRADGSRDLEASSIVVSNDYALGVARQHPEILPSASVHPYRHDALDELTRVAEAGAVLIKLLPVSQIFDPAAVRLRPYWRRAAELGLPLLVHTGLEFTLSGHAQTYGDPALLEAPLAEGATVIAAHACSRGVPFGETHFAVFKRLVARYPNFLADASALTIIGRLPMLLKLRREPALLERLIFATDYPVPPSALPLLAAGELGRFLRVRREPNPFDRVVQVFESLGITPSSAPLERLLAARAAGGRAGASA